MQDSPRENWRGSKNKQTKKKQNKKKNLITYEDNFQDCNALTATNMTSQVTCSLPLVYVDSPIFYICVVEIRIHLFNNFNIESRAYKQNKEN